MTDEQDRTGTSPRESISRDGSEVAGGSTSNAPVGEGATATSPPRRRGWLLLAGGAALIAVALGIVLYQLWPDISYNLGLIDASWPYASRFAEESSAEDVPKGDRIVIPKIGVDAQVSGGNSAVALSQGVYHHSETAEPGEGDNVALAGHRERETFVLLYQLDPGDPVSLWWNGEEHTYRVTRVYEVTPDDGSVLASSDEEQLTMYTCLPRFLGNKRTVVEAEPAEPESAVE
jgi:sortase A